MQPTFIFYSQPLYDKNFVKFRTLKLKIHNLDALYKPRVYCG